MEKYIFAEILGRAGARMDICPRDNSVPLLLLVRRQQLELLAVFLGLGVDPNFPDKKGRAALHYAVNFSEKGADASFEVAALLLKFGADIDRTDC